VLGPRYAFISACLKGEEPKTINSAHIERMMAESELQDALATIRETSIGSYLEELPVSSFNDLDEALWRYLAQRIRYVESFKFLPGDILKVSRAYVQKYDVLNIKAALQLISGVDRAAMIPVGVISAHGLLDELCGAESVDDIIRLLIQCRLGDYVPALEQYKAEASAKAKMQVETRLDGEYYKGMLNMARAIKDGSVLTKALGLAIDLTNLQIACRAIIEEIGLEAADFIIAGGYRIPDKTIRELLPLKVADMPERLDDAQYRDIASEVSAAYERTRSITAVDEVIDKHEFRLLKEMLSPRVMSPLVMAWYIMLKEIEIRNLRMVIKTIIDGAPSQGIENCLVL
jgi:vacuolar-type H+-ATPase subunit C/Vma6